MTLINILEEIEKDIKSPEIDNPPEKGSGAVKKAGDVGGAVKQAPGTIKKEIDKTIDFSKIQNILSGKDPKSDLRKEVDFAMAELEKSKNPDKEILQKLEELRKSKIYSNKTALQNLYKTIWVKEYKTAPQEKILSIFFDKLKEVK